MRVSDSEIIYAYNNFSTKEALEYLGIAQSTYYKRLEDIGIERNKTKCISDEQIINTIKECTSIREAAKKLGIHHSSLNKRMHKLNIHIENKRDHRVYKVNDKIFSSLSEETAYWLGFIAADGSIVDNTLRFIINKRDEETLHKFLKFCDSNYKVHYHTAHYTDNDGIKHNFDAVNLKITSEKIVKDLAKYGIVQNKKNLDIPFIEYIPKQYRIDFIIGFFDGDGSVNTKGYTITIATNHNNLTGILIELSDLGINFSISNRDKIDVIYIRDKKSYMIFKNVYLNRKYQTMLRKYNKFKEN